MKNLSSTQWPSIIAWQALKWNPQGKGKGDVQETHLRRDKEAEIKKDGTHPKHARAASCKPRQMDRSHQWPMLRQRAKGLTNWLNYTSSSIKGCVNSVLFFYICGTKTNPLTVTVTFKQSITKQTLRLILSLVHSRKAPCYNHHNYYYNHITMIKSYTNQSKGICIIALLIIG